jgi:predicted transcriptional regulator of viral defense system
VLDGEVNAPAVVDVDVLVIRIVLCGIKKLLWNTFLGCLLPGIRVTFIGIMTYNNQNNIPRTRTLGPLESRVVLSLAEYRRSLIRVSDLTAILGSESKARRALRALIDKGWLARVIGGKYLFLPPERGPEKMSESNPFALAAAVIEPSYIGWWSAAAWHGFTPQVPMTVFVAVTKQAPQRTIDGTDIRFVTVLKRKFFGYEPKDVYGRLVPLSTPAKTLVDCLDRPDLAGGVTELARIAHSALGALDPEEILKAAIAQKSTAVLQRLGYLADKVGRPLPESVRARLRAAIPKTFRGRLGRREPQNDDVGYVADWSLTVNVSSTDLLAEVPRIGRSLTRPRGSDRGENPRSSSALEDSRFA